MALPDADARIPVDSGGEHQTGLESFRGQRPQRGLFEREVLTDTDCPVGDPAGVIGFVKGPQPVVEFGQAGHDRDGHEMVATKTAALAFDAAFLVCSVDTRLAVERVEAVMRPEGEPAGGFGAGPAEQHP
jgi:hypothetical protein